MCTYPCSLATTSDEESCNLMELQQKCRLPQQAPPPAVRQIFRPRKGPQQPGHSNLEVDSSFGGATSGGGVAGEGPAQEENVAALYTVFQLAIAVRRGAVLEGEGVLGVQWSL